MRLWIVPAGLLAFAAPAAAQRTPLGIYGTWGAFAEPGRCFALAEPEGPLRSEPRPFASVSWWPRQGARGQVNFRLARPKRPGSAVLLRIDDRTFQLIGGGNNAWAEDGRADAEIVAAMRTGVEMSLETRAENGAPMRDIYRLRGAATAIDAAAIGCARR